MTAVPSTFFTAPPNWEWLVILYFFVGGIAGGSYFLAALIDLFGSPLDRALARLGYYVAFPATVVSGLLLVFDLTRPLRFWHMLVESETWRPMFKFYSPISLGSWALLLFGLFTFLAFLAALAEAGRLSWLPLRALRPPGVLGTAVSLLGGALAFFVAGYTGVLLSVTNRPIWADTNLLGLVFLMSSASTSAALLALLSTRRTRLLGGVERLQRFDTWVLALEFLALLGLVLSLGSLARLWLNVWGALFVIGVLVVGVLLPLALHWRQRHALGLASPAAAAVLVLVGGFLLRVVVVLSSEGV